MSELTSLRQAIRARRRALPPATRAQADQAIYARVERLAIFQNAHHLAAYSAFDGEFDPQPLVTCALDQGKHVYLPVLIAPRQAMLFAPYQPATPLRRNWFGLLEPDVPLSAMREPAQIELVLTPLVGFDEQCNRLGVGGGYYDRSFALLLQPQPPAWPRLLGLAYEVQKALALPRRAWDVPLAGVVTEAGLYAPDPAALLP